MSIASYLHDLGCDQVEFRDKCMYTIMDTRLLQSGRPKRKPPVTKTSEELEDWIQNDHLLQPTVQDGEKLEGGLRLLIYKWSYKHDSDEKISNAPMPFKNKDVLGKLLKKLGVCQSYALDFVRRQHIPLRITFIGHGDAQKMRIVCQSPNFRKSFTTTTVSYDSKTRLTTGFLGYTSGQMSEVKEVLEESELDVHCSHPLLLPILMYMVAGSMLRRQLRDINLKIDHVQHQTGLLDDFLTVREPKSKCLTQGAVNAPGETQAGSTQTTPLKYAKPSPSSRPSSSPSPRPPATPISGPVQNASQQLSAPIKRTQLGDSNRNPAQFTGDPTEEKPNYDKIHQVLVEQHARLTSGLSDFVEDLGKGCQAALSKIEASDIGKKILNKTTAHQELNAWVLQLELAAKSELQHRQRMLSRVDMQLKVLYNLMQQNIADDTRRDSQTMKQIADETLRDSSAMKGIALVTMIFLPSTALATIFSMSSFFSTTSENNRLLVSPQFYIFWCAAIPLTVVVISIYTLWAQRSEVRVWYAEKYQKQRKGLGSETERGRDLERGERSNEVSQKVVSSHQDREQV